MKLTLCVLLALVFTTAAFSTNPPYYSITLQAPYNQVGASSGDNPGPVNVGGRLAAQCTLTYPQPVGPPVIKHVGIDTANNFVYIGVLFPNGSRGPCHENVSYAGGTSLPSPDVLEPGDTPAPGLHAGADHVTWIYLTISYSEVNFTSVWCDGVTATRNTFPPNGYPC
jgi:hypothetical protein